MTKEQPVAEDRKVLTGEGKTCGIIMPISDWAGRPASHWGDIRNIIESSAEALNFKTRLVSDTSESNLIHKEILANIYNDDIIICDVSGHNPNVFFELGIRMATQKPIVIVKDDDTTYPFDTGPNRYIPYPKDLRYPLVEKFKADLIQALITSVGMKPADSFIGQLGPIKVPDIAKEKTSAEELILDRLVRIDHRIRNIESKADAPSMKYASPSALRRLRAVQYQEGKMSFAFQEIPREVIERVGRTVSALPSSFGIDHFSVNRDGPGSYTLLFEGESLEAKAIERAVINLLENAI